jgi:predicted signal transduction protein with EAL and GGDEF domain
LINVVGRWAQRKAIDVFGTGFFSLSDLGLTLSAISIFIARSFRVALSLRPSNMDL